MKKENIKQIPMRDFLMSIFKKISSSLSGLGSSSSGSAAESSILSSSRRNRRRAAISAEVTHRRPKPTLNSLKKSYQMSSPKKSRKSFSGRRIKSSAEKSSLLSLNSSMSNTGRKRVSRMRPSSELSNFGVSGVPVSKSASAAAKSAIKARKRKMVSFK